MVCVGIRLCLPLPESDSVGRSRREAHRKRGRGVGPSSGSRSPPLCSFASSLSQFVVNCNSVQNMPTVTFIISGSQFPLPPSAYVLNVRIHSQDPGKCHWLGPTAVLCPSSHLGGHGESPGAGLSSEIPTGAMEYRAGEVPAGKDVQSAIGYILMSFVSVEQWLLQAWN